MFFHRDFCLEVLPINFAEFKLKIFQILNQIYLSIDPKTF